MPNAAIMNLSCSFEKMKTGVNGNQEKRMEDERRQVCIK